MKKIVDYWLINKNRPLKFRRDYKFDIPSEQTNQIKETNPINDKTLIVSNC